MKRLVLRTYIIAVLASALAYSVVSAGAVTQGFKASTDIPSGAVVSLTKGTSDTVEKTTLNNESSLVGVTANAQDALIDIEPAGSIVRVAVNGDTSILVTDLNGDINVGDQLIISPLAGIAMRLTNDAAGKKIIAIAGQSFNASSSPTKEVSIEQANGTKKTVLVGRITAKLQLSDRGLNTKSSTSSIASLAQKLTGRETSPIQVVASSVIAISTFALSGLILNSSVKGSFISLGRNPLSKDSIVSGLLRAVMLGIIIIGVGLSLAYVILLV